MRSNPNRTRRNRWAAPLLTLILPWSLLADEQTAAGHQSRSPATAPSSAALFAMGCERLVADDPVSAISFLSHAVARQPDRIEYSLKLADAYRAAGRADAAQRLLENLIATGRPTPDVRRALARVYANGSNWPAVLQALTPLERNLDPEDLVLLGEAQRRTGDPLTGADTLAEAVKRAPDNLAIVLAWVDAALRDSQPGVALSRIEQADPKLRISPQMHFRSAQAYFALGRELGQTQVRSAPGRSAGQFAGPWLLVEPREGPDSYLCCPPASALYQIRQALDAGLDDAEVHLLHARIWCGIGRPEIALSVLESRAALLLNEPAPATLRVFAETSLAANRIDQFLHYSGMLARAEPGHPWMYEALLTVADHFNERGDEHLFTEFLRRALELKPNDADRMLQLADALALAGDPEAARWYQRVLEKSPMHPERVRVLSALESLLSPAPPPR